jgi:hypothetical protein
MTVEDWIADLGARWNAKIVDVLNDHVEHELTVRGPTKPGGYELICRTCDTWVMWAPPVG